MNKTIMIVLTWLMAGATHAQQSIPKESFDIINLNYPGLQKVKTAVNGHRYDEAATLLLQYYRKKYNGKEPDFSNAESNVDINQKISKATQAAADSALLHKFQPQKGYGFFDYGKDINWQYWPVKDNEVRWQLHRVRWWQSMALVYNTTHNEQYAREWMLQFSDWAKKNRQGLSKDNDRFAWRPLEVSDRVQSLAPTFSIFINAKSFTPAFLMNFLTNYQAQADYLSKNFAEEGNHRLFEAQRTLFAGASFPEFKNAPRWRSTGIDVLNTEIKKQVYPDGIQFELSPVYHAAAIDIFLKAYRTAQKAGLEKEFPDSYKKTVENMIMAYINITFPDYNQPMFGDSWIGGKDGKLRQFQSWQKLFPDNKAIQYFANDGNAPQPSWLTKGLTTAGFYTFRNGWDSSSTIMVLKASPPGEFHAQPDNGTFELWVNGRNFTPDAGVFVYSGDAEITKQRNWYRQTRIHSTLTLNDENMIITKAHLDKWQPSPSPMGEGRGELLTYTNPSYKDLDHQRSVLFIDGKYFLIIDKAIGKATGTLDAHFVLKEDSKPVYDKDANKVYTSYADGNNLLIQNLNSDKVSLKKEQGKLSYFYQKELPRPLFAFEKPKTDARTQTFITILYPYSGSKTPAISLKENAGNDFVNGKVEITLTVDGMNKRISARL
ncbi:heparin-sulfate lyase HepC [Niabella hirudinis]|uniref:heparin-sulfate lyase HepC n=1 Tax=Niabella hirudinis TaxID=1285929 RepID=UPI003EBDED91